MFVLSARLPGDSPASIVGSTDEAFEERPPSSSSAGSKRKPSDVDDKLLAYLEKKGLEDEFSAFGKFVAISLRNLSKRNSSMAKIRIHQVIAEYELKEITESGEDSEKN